jgi:hypothetical protein
MNTETQKFLDVCTKYGIKRVAIRVRDNRIPGSKTYPFDPSESVFATGKHKGWPAIWRVCDDMGYRGCGNHQQHDIPYDVNLEDGIYLRDAGSPFWSKKLESRGGR